MKRCNPVAKYNNDFNKPATHRDRKKHPSKKEERRDHPIHEPYERDHRNLTHDAIVGLGFSEIWFDDEEMDDA